MLEINKIYCGDCLNLMKFIDDNSIDAIVTDPPYEIGFMGKSWDSTGVAYQVELWREVLRVLKPGGYLLSFGGTRTYHRMACAIEDAGFEIRDMIEWIYGSGFPKSLNIGKAVDKIQGNERKVVAIKEQSGAKFKTVQEQMDNGGFNDPNRTNFSVDKGTSEWEGWGTALKPAHEPICMARKPLSEKSVAENCLKWGTGGINIDECRINGKYKWRASDSKIKGTIFKNGSFSDKPHPQGRFPANLIHDGSDEVIKLFPNSKSGKYKGEGSKSGGIWNKSTGKPASMEYGDSGSAARFFYCAKASKAERNMGCEELEEKEEVYPGINTFDENGNRLRADGSVIPPLKSKNNHPTIKPIALMKYLINLVSREGQIILDPFAGSGSTLGACKIMGRNFIGMEISQEYCDIANKRIADYKQQLKLEIK